MTKLDGGRIPFATGFSEGAFYAQHMRERGYNATANVSYGQVGSTLVSLAEPARADLVVAGAQGLTGERRFLTGSVSETVTTHAPCAVLVYRSAVRGAAGVM